MAIDAQKRRDELQDCIRDLYGTFHKYPLAHEISPDGAFPGFCDDRPLRATPLNSLPPEAFNTYQWKAITTWGYVEDFKHFLPRLLELVAQEAQGISVRSVDRFMIFGKLLYGDWRSWPSDERLAIDRYFMALWRVVLCRPIDAVGSTWIGQSAEAWLDNFAHAELNLSPLLLQWLADLADVDDGLPAAEHLAAMIVDCHIALVKSDSLMSFEVQQDKVRAWLASDPVFELLEAAFFRWPQAAAAALLSEGHYWLDWWRRNRPAVEP